MDAKQNIFDFQMKFFEIFKSQNPENVALDVVFGFDDGKKLLYANKSRLSVVSPTFESMLSERWASKNDEPIQIKNYSFEDFKEFLTFIYSGECSLTDENIYAMIDISEFYDVQIIKNACDIYLSKMKITMENIFTIMETTNKYSLVEVKKPVQNFLLRNLFYVVKCEQFLNANQKTIKKLIIFVLHDILPEALFQAVCIWVEHQVKQKFKSNDPKFNEAIKAEITSFLPYIDLKKMDLKFLHTFVVKKGFLFTYDELSDILNNAVPDPSVKVKVRVTNSYGQSIAGFLPYPRDSFAFKIIKVLRNLKSVTLNSKTICWPTKGKFPRSSSIKKRNGIEWYLILFPDGDIGVKHCSAIQENTFLLAEMTAESSYGFVITTNCKIEIE